jgi:uncharacterized protein with GYD domain
MAYLADEPLIGGMTMPMFIMALSINPNAKRQHSDLPRQISDSLDAFHQSGVKVKNLYATMGRYDCLAVFEADDQKLAFRLASQINSLGILETETWPVIPFEEFTELLH